MIIKELAQSDVVGAIASGLCVIHCMLTPFLFAVQSCQTSCCDAGPSWWSSIDYIFLVITFFAVHQSCQNSSNAWIKQSLYATWAIITLLILNEKIGILNIDAIFKYVVTFGLIGLHIYNLTYCQCSNDSCVAS